MTGPDVINTVKALDLPAGSYVIFGSGPLAVAGLREAHDIDLFVVPSLFEQLMQAGWHQVMRYGVIDALTNDNVEAFKTWSFNGYEPDLHELIKRADTVNDVAVASLADILECKQSMRRPKDLDDVALIQTYYKTLIDSA